MALTYKENCQFSDRLGKVREKVLKAHGLWPRRHEVKLSLYRYKKELTGILKTKPKAKAKEK